MQDPLNPQNMRINAQSKNKQMQIKRCFIEFIQQFREQGEKKYIKRAQELLNLSRHILLVNHKDFWNYSNELADAIMNEYSKYQLVLNRALTQFMYQIEKNFDMNVSSQKREINEEDMQTYEVSFDKGLSNGEMDESIRSLKCQQLGKLKSIVGTVTRVSEVRPQLIEAIFICEYCGRLSQKIVQQYKYTMPKRCLSEGCSNNSMWTLINRCSLFADFQRLRLQEDSSKIPPGSMPRSIDVILRNQNIERGQPGDQVHVVGYLSVVPDVSSLIKPGERTSISTLNNKSRADIQPGIQGIKGVKQLNYKLVFIGINIYVMNNQFNEEILTQQEAQDENELCMSDDYNEEQILTKLLSKFKESQILQIKRIKQNPKIYEHLSQSLFHQIFGHSQIKKALLLQLLGGIHKKTQTKISIRGDVNVLIVGDPSTAKSQFLKCVNKFVPRSVYTNGKTTTAAGLTASVMRDDQTGNVSIQAGALLLADNGICCIDEFDKMQLKDQVAIHEAMEQQTISIAKAGIQATLHARTSILAAANPLFGRYDKSQSLRKNINISPPIMSRFDLYFIICDQVNQISDSNLSQFIVSMHQQKKQVKVQKPYTIRQVRNYLRVAKRLKPRLTREAAEDLRRFYVEIRKSDKANHNSQYQVTVRQLQSMIRLSQALAKLHLDTSVKAQYVRQAYRLLSCSIVKLEKSAIQLVDQEGITENQKQSMGILSILSQRQKGQKKKQKITIDHETYEQVRKDILRLFNQKQTRHRQNRIQDVQLILTQSDVIAYLLAINFESGQMSSQEQNSRINKLYHALINHLIKDKTIIVLQESKDPDQRKLSLHPNVQVVDMGMQVEAN